MDSQIPETGARCDAPQPWRAWSFAEVDSCFTSPRGDGHLRFRGAYSRRRTRLGPRESEAGMEQIRQRTDDERD